LSLGRWTMRAGESPMISQRTAGWSALASGLVSIAATAFLMAFYALEAPRLLEAGDLDQPTPLGHTNDVLIAVTLILLLPVVSFAAHAGGAALDHPPRLTMPE
jgi:hypothetical protein